MSYITIEEGLEHVTYYESGEIKKDRQTYRSKMPYTSGNTNNVIIRTNSYSVNDYLLDWHYLNMNLKGENSSLINNYNESFTRTTSSSEIAWPEVNVQYTKVEGDVFYYTITLGSNDYDDFFLSLECQDNKRDFVFIHFKKGQTQISGCSEYAIDFYSTFIYARFFIVKGNCCYYNSLNSDVVKPIKKSNNNFYWSPYEPSIETAYLIVGYDRSDYFRTLTVPQYFDYFCCSECYYRPIKDTKSMCILVNNLELTYDNSVYIKGNSSEYFIPVWEFDADERKVTFKQKVTGFNGLSVEEDIAMTHYTTSDNEYAPKVRISRKDNSTLGFETFEPIPHSNGPRFYVVQINNTNSNEWQTYQNGTSNEWNFENNSAEHKTDGYYFTKDITFEKSNEAFIKVASSPNINNIPTYLGPYNLSSPTIFYTGTAGTGDYDLLMKNGQSTSTLAVQSDAPVFVHTLVTKQPYSKCKNWSAEKWEYLHKHIGEKYLDFSSTEHTARRYNIPVNQIDSGDCYVVIAHFSDNHTEMSEVMVK